MIGFNFKNRHLSEFPAVFMKSDNRTLRPEIRKLTATIPGRDGTLDFGNDGYETRDIEVTLSMKTGQLPELRTLVRELAYWLSGSGQLIFDDEPDKAYHAQVIRPIDLEQISRTGKSQITFTCQPFAEALDYHRILQTVTKAAEEIPLVNIGTQETPCRITITNIGNTNIVDIILTRLSTG